MLLSHLTWLDVWAITTSLYGRRQKLGKAIDGVRRLPLRDGDWTAPELNGWNSAKNMLTRCNRLARESFPDWRISAAELEWLEPGSALPWIPGEDGVIHAHIGVVVNPAARLYAGVEMCGTGWGEVVLSSPNARAKRSASNSGETPRVHMVLTLRRNANAAGEEGEA